MIETELIQTEKLSVAPVVPFQALSACGEEECFNTVQAEEGCLEFGCVKGQYLLARPRDHIIYFWL